MMTSHRILKACSLWLLFFFEIDLSQRSSLLLLIKRLVNTICLGLERSLRSLYGCQVNRRFDRNKINVMLYAIKRAKSAILQFMKENNKILAGFKELPINRFQGHYCFKKLVALNKIERSRIRGTSLTFKILFARDSFLFSKAQD